MRQWILICAVLLWIAPLSAQQTSFEKTLNQVHALQEEGKLQEAVDLMNQAVEQNPQSAEAHLQLGMAWGQLGQHGGNTGDFGTAMSAIQECFSAFDKALELDPDNVDAHITYGGYGVNVPEFFGKLDAGVAHLEKALALIESKSGVGLTAEHAQIPLLLGQGYQKQGHLDKAQKMYDKALALSPEDKIAEQVKIALAGLKSAKKESEKPASTQKEETGDIQSIKVKLEQKPDDFQLLFDLGKAYFAAGRWEDARKALHKAVAQNPTHFDVNYLLVQAIMQDVNIPYDERVYDEQDVRTNLAFEMTRQLEKTYKLAPDNIEVKMMYAFSCVMMPFFVQKIDAGLAMLEEIASDNTLPDSVRAEALYYLGFGHQKKGNAYWMQIVKDFPKSRQMQDIYHTYGLRWDGKEKAAAPGEKVTVSFHMGFMDELAPQTAVWVEDADGAFVKTLYVSGFSGHAREKQVNLPRWAKASAFETDGTTSASIDWGKHTYVWDLTDHAGKRVADGNYTVFVEVSWWPSMEYGRASTKIRVGGQPSEQVVEKAPHLPWVRVAYKK